MESRRWVLLAALLLCTAPLVRAGNPPTIYNFSADKTEIVRGQRVELYYSASPVTTIEIAPLGLTRSYGSGSYYFWPQVTQTYELRATNQYGTSTAEVTVSISKQFDIVSFTASDELVGTQDAVVLNWEVFGVGEVTIDGDGPYPMSGTLTDIPHETHTYLLEVNGGGEYASAAVDVVVTGEWRRSRFVLSYSSESLETTPNELLPFTTIPVYVLGESLDGFGLAGVEFGLSLTPDLLLMEVDFHSWRAINVLSSPDFVVGLGTCFQTDPLHLIATLTIMAMNQNAIEDGSLHLRPAAIPSIPGTVAYATCDFELEGSEINHPLTSALIGPALYLSADGVPVISMHLRADRDERGVWLQWDAVDVIGVDRFELTRAVGSGLPRPILAGDAERMLTSLEFRDEYAPEGELSYALLLYSGNELLHQEGVKLDGREFQFARSILLPNAPNPFNPSTTLRWRAALAGQYELRIVNVSGRLVRSFAFSIGAPGAQETFWDGRDEAGRQAASGVYHVQLIAPDGRDQLRVVLLK